MERLLEAPLRIERLAELCGLRGEVALLTPGLQSPATLAEQTFSLGVRTRQELDVRGDCYVISRDVDRPRELLVDRPRTQSELSSRIEAPGHCLQASQEGNDVRLAATVSLLEQHSAAANPLLNPGGPVIKARGELLKAGCRRPSRTTEISERALCCRRRLTVMAPMTSVDEREYVPETSECTIVSALLENGKRPSCQREELLGSAFRRDREPQVRKLQARPQLGPPVVLRSRRFKRLTKDPLGILKVAASPDGQPELRQQVVLRDLPRLESTCRSPAL